MLILTHLFFNPVLNVPTPAHTHTHAQRCVVRLRAAECISCPIVTCAFVNQVLPQAYCISAAAYTMFDECARRGARPLSFVSEAKVRECSSCMCGGHASGSASSCKSAPTISSTLIVREAGVGGAARGGIYIAFRRRRCHTTRTRPTSQFFLPARLPPYAARIPATRPSGNASVLHRPSTSRSPPTLETSAGETEMKTICPTVCKGSLFGGGLGTRPTGSRQARL